MTPPFRLRIPATIVAAMVGHARETAPAECCGLLSGRIADGVGQVEARWPLVNVLNSPVLFESEPRGMFDACKGIRAAGQEWLAVYHSHPATDPVPSRTDRERSPGETVACVIVGLAGAEPDVRAWWLTAASHAPAEMTVHESAGEA